MAVEVCQRMLQEAPASFEALAIIPGSDNLPVVINTDQKTRKL